MTDTTTSSRSRETRATVLTFLIAGIRGYSTFTRERVDADAAKLARKPIRLEAP